MSIWISVTMKTIILFTSITLNILVTEPRKCVREIDVVRHGESLATRLKVPMGSSDDLINDLIEYYVYVESCLKKKNLKNSRESKTIQTLLKNDGPPHIKVSVSDKFLKENYNISEVEVDEIKDILVDTKVLWKDMKNLTLS